MRRRMPSAERASRSSACEIKRVREHDCCDAGVAFGAACRQDQQVAGVAESKSTCRSTMFDRELTRKESYRGAVPRSASDKHELSVQSARTHGANDKRDRGPLVSRRSSALSTIMAPKVIRSGKSALAEHRRVAGESHRRPFHVRRCGNEPSPTSDVYRSLPVAS